MAKSRFEYVKSYELPDILLPNTFLVVRVDGHAFHKFSDAHGFTKPNDERALMLMDRAARTVLEQMPDVVMAFGESDEYSFLIRRGSTMYKRRESKILTLLLSLFTSSYVYHWTSYFLSSAYRLQYPPTFDGRVVQYPNEKEIRDYFAWRQADTHVNNLYNTTFWALILQGGQSTTEAHKTLNGTFSSDKNEMLFQRFGMNYNALPARFRKGSIVLREESKAVDVQESVAEVPESMDAAAQETNTSTPSAPISTKAKRKEKPKRPFDGTSGDIVILHEDIIRDAFWNERPWLLQ